VSRASCARAARCGPLARLLAPGLAALALLLAATSAGTAAADEPPRFEVPAPAGGGPLMFIAYGDTRFTRIEGSSIVNGFARRALVNRMARENPAAIFIGGDLVYQGSDPDDYQVFRDETAAWVKEKIPVFPSLGNHEFKGCTHQAPEPCLENWWHTFPELRPYRWYSVSVGPTLLVLLLDSDSAFRTGSEQRIWFEQQVAAAAPHFRFLMVVLHYPPVRDPFYPSMLDEKEVARYFARHAASLHQQVIVIGSHVHNYERYVRDGVTYLVSGGGGAKPVPAVRLFGERSKLHTSVNYHFVRFTLESERLSGTMVRFEATDPSGNSWSEPDHFELRAKN
jgi:acid phosphatase type 7